MQNYCKPKLCNLPRDTLFVYQWGHCGVHKTFSSHFKGWVPRVGNPDFSSCLDRIGKLELMSWGFWEDPCPPLPVSQPGTRTSEGDDSEANEEDEWGARRWVEILSHPGHVTWVSEPQFPWCRMGRTIGQHPRKILDTQWDGGGTLPIPGGIGGWLCPSLPGISCHIEGQRILFKSVS